MSDQDPLTICWYEVAKGGSVVVAPAARSLLRPPLYEDGRVAVVEEVRHRAVGEAGGRKGGRSGPRRCIPKERYHGRRRWFGSPG